MKTIKKLGLVSAVAFAMLALSACDDSSSASSNEPDENAAVDSSSSVCKDCDDESSSSAKKIESSAEEAGSSTRTTSSKSSSSGKTAFSGLSDSGASSSSIEKKSSTSTEDMACSKEGYIKSVWDRASQSWVDYICSNNYYIPASEYVPSSSSKYPVMDSVFNSELSYGEFEDPRDHQIYKTRTLTLSNGQKIEVFAQNLNYGKFLKEGDEIIEGDTIKFCYDDDEWYCDNFYGGQYTWAGVMGFPYACNDHKTNTVECPFILDADDYGRQYRGICPEGWHITNKREWAVGIVGGRGSLSVSKASGGVDAAGLSILLRNDYACWFLPSVLDGNLQESDALAQVLNFSIKTGEFGYAYKDATAEITGKYVPDSKHRSIVGVRCTRDYGYEN